jgi:UDP-N-acetylmuramate: L-alanyl-gamma-D-glutamyl-meso-diaminopimelate ligase
VDSFLEADVAFISSPPFRHNDDRSNFMDVGIVTAKLMATGVDARSMPDHDSMKRALADTVRSGDVVLIMSNGGFGGIHGWLADHLRLDAA